MPEQLNEKQILEAAQSKAIAAARSRAKVEKFAFRTLFGDEMTKLGFRFTNSDCLCSDLKFGHEPACGWSFVVDLLLGKDL